MENLLFCYKTDVSDEKRLLEAFNRKGEGVRLFPVSSAEAIKKEYKKEKRGVVFISCVGDIQTFLAEIEGITTEIPGISVICMGNRIKSEEVALIRKSGIVHYLEQDQINSVFDIVKNLQEGKAGKKLTEKEIFRQYEFFLDISDTYLSMIGRDYSYLAINEAFCRAHNIKRQDLIGNTPIKLWGEQTFLRVIKPYLDQSFSKQDIKYRAWFEVPGEGKRFFEVMFRPHINEANEVDYVVVSSRDITQEEKTKEQIRHHNEDMGLVNMLYQMHNNGASLDEMTEKISERTVKIFRAFSCNVFLNNASGELQPIRFRVPEKAIQEAKNFIGYDVKNITLRYRNNSIIYNIFTRGKTVQITGNAHIRKVAGELTGLSPQINNFINQLLTDFPVKAVLSIPLKMREKKLGIMLIPRYVPFSNQEIRRIKRLAYQITLLLEHQEEDKQYKEQSEKIRLLFETAEDAIFLMKDYVFVDYNASTLRMFGVKKHEIIGKSPVNFSPAVQPGGGLSEEMALKYMKFALQGVPQTFEWLNQTKSGKTFFTQVKLNRLFLQGDAFLQAIVRNIDEEKKNRMKLEESERNLREAQKIARLGDWRWNLFTNQVRWSDEFYRILGLNPQTSPASLRLLTQRIHPEDRRRILRKTINAAKECTICEDQFRLQLPDGSIKYIRSSGVLERKDGKPLMWHGVIYDITALKKAEMALRVSESRFRTIFSESFYAMSVLSRDGSFEDTNRACNQLFGYSPDKFKKMTCYNLVIAEERKEMKEVFSKLEQGKINSYSGERSYFRKDGNRIWTQTGITAIHHADGRIKHYITTLIDITDRKKAEEKVYQQTRELNLINRLNLELNRGATLQEIIHALNSSLKGIYSVQNILVYTQELPGVENRFRLISQTFTENKITSLRKITGNNAELSYLNVSKNKYLKSLIESGAPVLISSQEELIRFIEEFFKNRDLPLSGKMICHHLGIRSLIFYPMIKEKKLTGIFILINNQQFQQEILKEISRILIQTSMIILKKLNETENQRLYTAIEQLNEVMVISDKTGRILYINQAIEKLLGSKRNTLIGKNTKDFRHPGVNSSYFQNIWNTVARGKIWSGLLKIKSFGGKTIPTHTIITPILNEKKEVVYYVSVMRDISQELAMEQYLQRSQKLEMIGRFAGGLAHDFNNILATILGYIDMVMEETEKKSMAYHSLKKARSSGLKAQEVIQQLLTFNRGIEPEKKLTDPLKILAESLELLKPQISKNITVKINHPEQNLSLHVDPVQLRQVFLNLLSNALYAVEEKNKGRIGVTFRDIYISQEQRHQLPDLTRTHYVFIIFEDNGSGMEKDVVDKIFEPFFTTKPVGKGSGMGLSVVHGIVQNHDGTIQVNSTPGEGTSISVYLPVS